MLDKRPQNYGYLFASIAFPSMIPSACIPEFGPLRTANKGDINDKLIIRDTSEQYRHAFHIHAYYNFINIRARHSCYPNTIL